MKKQLLIIFLLFIVTAGCGDVEPDNTNTVKQVLLSENTIINGRNDVVYDNTTEQLHTLVYFAGNKYGNYNSRGNYTISSSKYSASTMNNSIYTRNAVEEVNPKELINEMNRDIIKYAENTGIQPIEPDSDDVLLRAAPQYVEVGTPWKNLYVLDISYNRYRPVNATCIARSEHAYFFLEDGLTPLTDEQIATITTSFDKNYKLIHKYYDKETDTDGNRKVSFLIANINSSSVYGFFTSADKYKNSQLPPNIKSNESDILYVNHYYFSANEWALKSQDVVATFIHEFQHMVLFDSRARAGLPVNVSIWIQEGLSMLSEYYGGYGSSHNNYVNYYFLSEQGKSLITDDSTQSYGLSYLFMRYLQIRFGDKIIKKIYASARNGTQMIEDATGMDFDDLFLDFTKMILVTGRGISTDPKYNIAAFNGAVGSAEYNQTGFNLSSIIDGVYSDNSMNQLFITSTGYSSDLQLYGFRINKWSSNIDNLTFTGSNGINGFYYAW